MLAGSALAIHGLLGEQARVVGVEPEGAPNLTRSLAAGEVVPLERIATAVQGLCPPDTGELNLALARRHVQGTLLLSDEEIHGGQRTLLRAGFTVEPAGAAAFAAVEHGKLAPELDGRSRSDPLRVACVVSGGNPDPRQMQALLA
jgi:threonine dehydratase